MDGDGRYYTQQQLRRGSGAGNHNNNAAAAVASSSRSSLASQSASYHPYAYTFPSSSSDGRRSPPPTPPPPQAPPSLPPLSSLPPLPSSSPALNSYHSTSSTAEYRTSRGESSPAGSLHGSKWGYQDDRDGGRRRGSSTTSASMSQAGPYSPDLNGGPPLVSGSPRQRHRSRPSRSDSSSSVLTSPPPHDTSVTSSPASSKSVLTIALERAQSAVLLDSDNNVPAAVAAYSQSVQLLKEVMMRVEESGRREKEREQERERERQRDGETEEERKRRKVKSERREKAKQDEAKRLRVIHDTYQDRIRMLIQMQAEAAASMPAPYPVANAFFSNAPAAPSAPRLFTTTSSPPLTPHHQEDGRNAEHRQESSPSTVFSTPHTGSSPPPSPMDPMMVIPGVASSRSSSAQQLSPLNQRSRRNSDPLLVASRSTSSSSISMSRRPSSPIPEAADEGGDFMLQLVPRDSAEADSDTDTPRAPSGFDPYPEQCNPPPSDGDGLSHSRESSMQDESSFEAASSHGGNQGEEKADDDNGEADDDESLPEMAGYSARALDDREQLNSSDDEIMPVTAQEYAGWPHQRSVDAVEEDPYGGMAQSPLSPNGPPTRLLPPLPPPIAYSSKDSATGLRSARSASLATGGAVRHSQIGHMFKPLVSPSTNLGTISQRRRSPLGHLSDGSKGGREFWEEQTDSTSEARLSPPPRLGIAVRPPSADGVESDFGPNSSTASHTYNSASLPSRLRALSQPGKRPPLGTYDTAPTLPRLSTPIGMATPSYARKNSVPTPTSLFTSLNRSLSHSSTGSASERDPGGRASSPSPYLRSSSALSERGDYTPASATFGRSTSSGPLLGGFFAPPPASDTPTTVTAPVRKPFHFMRQIVATIETGGYVTPKLYIPKIMWSQGSVKLVALETKVRMLDHLLTGLDALDKAGEGLLFYDGGEARGAVRNFVRELDVFEGLSDGIQSTLAKKLGYGTSGKKTSATSFSAWSSKLSRSLDRVTNGRSLDSPAEYVSGIARVFKQAQGIDQHLAYLSASSGAYAVLSSEDLRGIEHRLRRVSEFFGHVICQFVLRDLGILLDKFVKRGGNWVGTD